MTTMIEKVALELFNATPFKETDGSYEQQSDTYRRMCRLLARAAITAMKRPVSDAMIIAGTNAIHNGQNVSEIFDAMIDAALKEEAGE